jgi:hypothetical protein
MMRLGYMLYFSDIFNNYSDWAIRKDLIVICLNCISCGKSVKECTECGRCGSVVHFSEIGGCGAWLLKNWNSDDVVEINGFWCIECLNDFYVQNIVKENNLLVFI